jgi:DNA helicase-2/ATP-dependent DNA helicase PcrA
LLAGPGTGKTTTLIEHVVGLLHEGVAPERILCLTFTRAAAAGFRRRIARALPTGTVPPDVYTLHAFALKVLMARRVNLGSGRGQARVADDWEERFIVREDLKRILGTTLTDVKIRLSALSAAWETAPGTAPAVDPALLGALDQDKSRYGYVLRDELVFALAGQLGADPSLLQGAYDHIVVDEYQDLNPCDVRVVDELWRRGASLYVAGDDDQSIYEQLRHAHPQAIRDFLADHPGAADLILQTCVRCDERIVTLAQEVIAGEPGRVPKPLAPHASAGPGIVQLLTFPTQVEEAAGIAQLARKLVDLGVPLDEIMVLLRSDYRGCFSDELEAALSAVRVPSVVRTAEKSALATKTGRLLLAHLRLYLDQTDDLAWRTVLDCARNGVGSRTVDQLHARADGSGQSFHEVVAATAGDPNLVDRGALVRADYEEVLQRIADVLSAAPLDVEHVVDDMAARLPSGADLDAARGELVGLARSYLAIDLADFLAAIALKKEEEQSLVPETVNIMTMHKAKGLDACVVFIAAAEDEVLLRDNAGRNEARRLFYVSITRARHALFITHAVHRTGRQGYSGGFGPRSRSAFLRTRGASLPGTRYASDFAVDVGVLTPSNAEA